MCALEEPGTNVISGLQRWSIFACTLQMWLHLERKTKNEADSFPAQKCPKATYEKLLLLHLLF